MAFSYELSGIGLRSAQPLRGLEAARSGSRGAWRLLRRSSPFPFPNPKPLGGLARVVLEDGSIAAAWPGCGAFWIRPGPRRVEYRLESRASPKSFEDVVSGPLVSFLLVLEDLDALHASAVQVGAGAVCFMGPPGAGKSTSAARFLLAGHRLVADDVLALDFSGGRCRAVPGAPEIRLWPASGRRLLSGFSGLSRVAPRSSKRRLDPRTTPAGLSPRPLPVRAFYELRRRRGRRSPKLEPLSGAAALLALLSNIYNPTFEQPALRARQLDRLAALANAVPVRRLWVPRGADYSAQVRTLVLKDLGGA